MVIQHREEGSEGAFYVEENGEQLSELVYRKEPGRIVIEHTEVDEALRGQNIGFQLVEHAVRYAREQKLKVVPLCVFADKIIKQHKELQDVL